MACVRIAATTSNASARISISKPAFAMSCRSLYRAWVSRRNRLASLSNSVTASIATPIATAIDSHTLTTSQKVSARVSEDTPQLSVDNFEGRAVLRPRLTVVVYPRRGNVRMPQPFLDLGDVGLVIERIGSGCGTQRVRSDLKPQRRRISAYHLVDRVRRDGLISGVAAIPVYRPKQRPTLIIWIPSKSQIALDRLASSALQRQV